MVGWGSYVKPKKSKQQVALERRRELGNKFFSPLDELRQLAAIAKVKVKRLPYVPPEDPAVASARTDPDAPVTGPCQSWVDSHRRWREAGRPRGKVATTEPSERQKKLAATRAWNKARYQKTKATKSVKLSTAKSVKVKADKRRPGSEHPHAELRLYLIDDLPGPVR